MKMRRSFLRGMVLSGFAMAIVASSSAQSFNIDLETQSPPQLGGGAPSSTFAGAAGQPGFWNKASANSGAFFQLQDLNGNLTGADFVRPAGGIASGFNNPANTGDYAALFNDGRYVEDESWTFRAINNGTYRLYTYNVRPAPGQVTNSTVTVLGATVPVRIVTGPMPGNQFINGITHSIHDIVVTDNSLTVRVQEGVMHGFVSGFQLVAVPEPSSALFLAFGLPMLLRSRRQP